MLEIRDEASASPPDLARAHDPERLDDEPVEPVAQRVNSGPGLPPDLSIVVPTRNEAANVPVLLQRLQAAMAGSAVEVIFVDDSDDGTPQAVADAAQDVCLPVLLMHREAGQRAGGLSTAVIAGMRAAHGSWVLVMDGDLQHPPEVVPHMYKVARRCGADLVAGSRYAGSGAADGLNGGTRRGASAFATRVTKTVFPRRAARLSDPMSGFFVVRLAALRLDRLRPIGYKILLELVVRTPHLRTAEITFAFADRYAGESKASLAEVGRFGLHMARLRLQIARERNDAEPVSLRLRSLNFLLFGLVGLSGLVVNSAALWLLHLGFFQLHYLLAAALATQVSTTWNFVLTDRAVFRHEKAGTVAGRAVRFFAMNNVALVGRLPLLALLVTSGVGVLTANVMTLVLLFIVRFLISDRLIFARAAAAEPGVLAAWPARHLVDIVADAQTVDRARAKRIRYLPYRYDLAGLRTPDIGAG